MDICGLRRVLRASTGTEARAAQYPPTSIRSVRDGMEMARDEEKRTFVTFLNLHVSHCACCHLVSVELME